MAQCQIIASSSVSSGTDREVMADHHHPPKDNYYRKIFRVYRGEENELTADLKYMADGQEI